MAAACPGRDLADGGPLADSGTLDGGSVDAGQLDGGSDADAGEARDAGAEGEGEGEPVDRPCEACFDSGLCIALPERLDDIVDDAGMPHYENCFNAFFYENDCTLGECTTNDAQRAALAAAHQVAAERGYRIEVSAVSGSEYGVSLEGAVVVDWAKAFFGMRVDSVDGGIDVDGIRSRLPENVPASLPPFAEIVEELRACDPDVNPDICRLAADNAELYGTPVAECGWAKINLWNDNAPDAGCCQASCTPSDLPCCFREDFE